MTVAQFNEHGVFDYVVVGAGSAGCAIAARLSEDPSLRVCLIEAGPSDRTGITRFKSRIPTAGSMFRNDPRFDWQFEYEADDRLGGKPIPCPRGHILGGTSSINGMVYIRGHRCDYDDWAALGNVGWSYDDVLPWFRRSEDHWRGGDDFHGKGGSLSVSQHRHPHALSRTFVEAATQCQQRPNPDFNGAEQDGFGIYELTQRNGERWSSARAFLHPVMQRKNLCVLSESLCEGLRIENGTAVAVKVCREGRHFEIAAAGEIILAAGAIGSPHLLLLSGVGPAAQLSAKGVAVACDLPGVGFNLQDHVDVDLVYTDRSRTSYASTPRGLARLAAASLVYAVSRGGALSSNMMEAGGFVRTAPGLKQPDAQFHFAPLIVDRSRILPGAMHGFLLHACVLRPKSRGWLDLASADPAAAPLLHANFYSDSEDYDLRTMVRAVRLARHIIAAPALDPYRGEELKPGTETQSDAELEAFVRTAARTVFHPVGTCKMGVDTMAVVDPQLRVRGVNRLRVADASIMPNIVSGNTNAPSIMIGERGADFVRHTRRESRAA